MEADIDVASLIAAIIHDSGGELAVSSEALQGNYKGKAIEVTYIPIRDVWVLRLENLKDLENEDVG